MWGRGEKEGPRGGWRACPALGCEASWPATEAAGPIDGSQKGPSPSRKIYEYGGLFKRMEVSIIVNVWSDDVNLNNEALLLLKPSSLLLRFDDTIEPI